MAAAHAGDGLRPRLTTPVIATELWGGDWTAFPVADPSLIAYGVSMPGCLGELKAAIELHLAEAQPSVLARFSMPPAVELREVRVPLTRFDLPRTLQVSGQIAMQAVVVPFTDGLWVRLPALGHAFRVAPNTDIDEKVRSEVRRIAVAREPAPDEFLRLLPSGAPQLQPLEIEFDQGQARSARAKQRDSVARKRAFDVLESIGEVDIFSGPDPLLLGREEELKGLTTLLAGDRRLSALLVGPTVCGKTAVFRSWWHATRKLRDPHPVFATSGARLIAGMSGLGQWQERVQRVMKAAELLDAVLYFDDLSDLLSERGTEHIDICGAMRRYLEEGRVRIVGELDPDALAVFERRHPAFISLLAPVYLKPLSVPQTERVLLERSARQADAYKARPRLDPQAIPTLLDLTVRYLPYRALPGQAVELEEEVRALYGHERDTSGALKPLTSSHVFAAFSRRSGIPEVLLHEDRQLHAEELRAWFQSRLVGQHAAVERLVELLCVVKANLQPQGKPLANLLFVGPTGVGKTELARLLALYLFGAEDRLFRFDMSEYADGWAADRLLRATDNSEGTLTRLVRQQPFCVVLFDELEKAHPAVFDLLLQLLGEGRLTDARGRTSWFHNAIIVMTSNLGAAHRRTAIGLGAEPEPDATYYDRIVTQTFRPEFLNRIDKVVPFESLKRDEVRRLTVLALQRVRARRGLRDKAISLQLDAVAEERLASAGYSGVYGARALRRHLEDAVVAPAARLLSGQQSVPARSTIAVTTGPEELALTFTPGPARQQHANEEPMEVIQNVRRRLDASVALDRVQDVRDHCALLVSQLAMLERREKKRAVAMQEFGALQTELHFLRRYLDVALAHQREVHDLEELALGAFFDGQPLDELLAETQRLEAAFDQNLLRLLLVRERRRDEIALVVRELDSRRNLDKWVLPLLDRLPRWSWQATMHIAGDDNPPERRWGPERSVEAAKKILAASKDTQRHVLLRVRGPFAGVFLALEHGIHRIEPAGGGWPSWFDVRRLCLRSTLSDEELASQAAAIGAMPTEKELNAAHPVRTYEGRSDSIHNERGALIRATLEDYWKHWEALAVQLLVEFERNPELDRDALFFGPLDAAARPS